jgi:hypothetical protein
MCRIEWRNQMFLLCLQLAHAQPRYIRPGEIYQSGEPVMSMDMNTGFTIPWGWKGQSPENADAMLLASDSRPGSIYVITDTVPSLSALSLQLENPIPIDPTLVLSPSQEPTTLEGRIQASYLGSNETFTLVGELLAVRNDDGRTLTFIAVGPQEQQRYYRGLLDELAESARFPLSSIPTGAPVQSWSGRLSGKRLHRIDSTSKTAEESSYYLCSDGSFVFASIAASGPSGVGGGTESRGSWAVKGKRISLRHRSGVVETHALSTGGGYVYLDQRGFRLETNGLCL